MKGKLQQRLILPIILLGLVTLLSNILAVFSINNVHSNAGTIVDEYMVSEAKLEEIRRSIMDIHRLALSHIVAADHASMIRLVPERGGGGGYQRSVCLRLHPGGGGEKPSVPGVCHLLGGQRRDAAGGDSFGVGGPADHSQIRHCPHSGSHGHPSGQLPAHQRRGG